MCYEFGCSKQLNSYKHPIGPNNSRWMPHLLNPLILLRWAQAIEVWANAIKVWANASKMTEEHQMVLKLTNINKKFK